MILKVAILDVKPGQTDDFEQAFAKAQTIIHWYLKITKGKGKGKGNEQRSNQSSIGTIGARVD